MMQQVWLVWDGQALVAMFAQRSDAERRIAERRVGRSTKGDRDPQSLAIRLEPWTIAPPSGLPPFEPAGAVHRAVLEQVDREWGLLPLSAMGSEHYLRLDTYLLVAYNNRLVCPGFQFDGSGHLWPGVRDVLDLFREVGADEFSITSWFVSRQGSADGDIPALLIRRDPDRVVAAAHSTATDW